MNAPKHPPDLALIAPENCAAKRRTSLLMQFVRRVYRSSLHSFVTVAQGNRCLHAASVQSGIRYSGGTAPGSQLLLTSLRSSFRRSLVTLEQAQGKVAVIELAMHPGLWSIAGRSVLTVPASARR